jgi:hypothetical protein
MAQALTEASSACPADAVAAATGALAARLSAAPGRRPERTKAMRASGNAMRAATKSINRDMGAIHPLIQL